LFVRLRLAGRALDSALTRAFAHLRSRPRADGRSDLTVEAWDSASTGVPPPLPARHDDLIGTGYFSDGPEGRALHRPGWGQLDALDGAGTEGWHWVADAGRVPYWEIAAPLLPLLHWWSRAHGLQLVHGAAVGTDHGAVLLVGRGGSGKSTAAVACAAAGLRYLGDDYVIVDPGPALLVHSLFASAKLAPEHAARFPELAGPIWNSGRLDTEKAVTFLDERFPARLTASLPLRAVIRCRVSTSPVNGLRPASRADVLAGLAPSTIFQLAGGRPDALAGMARVVSALPTFALDVGGDPRRIPDVLSGFLDDMAR
jgi:hypothetical protein